MALGRLGRRHLRVPQPARGRRRHDHARVEDQLPRRRAGRHRDRGRHDPCTWAARRSSSRRSCPTEPAARSPRRRRPSWCSALVGRSRARRAGGGRSVRCRGCRSAWRARSRWSPGPAAGSARRSPTAFAEAGRGGDAVVAEAGRPGGGGRRDRRLAAGETAVFAANAGEPDQIAACVAATVERFGAHRHPGQQRRHQPVHGPGHRHRPAPLRQDLAGQLPRPGGVGPGGLAGLDGRARRVVINIASVGGLSVEARIGHYNVTKAALIHLTRTLAADLAPGVRVNAIAPGLVKTDLARALWEPAEEQIAARMPLQPPGRARRTSPTPPCSWPATWRRGSPARPWWSTAGRSSARDGCNQRGPQPDHSARLTSFPDRCGGARSRGRAPGARRTPAAPALTASRSCVERGRAGRIGGHDQRHRPAGPTRGPGRRRRPPRATAAGRPSTRSTAAGHTFSPPVTITSPTRPNTRRRPAAASHAPASPVGNQPSASRGSVPSR